MNPSPTNGALNVLPVRLGDGMPSRRAFEERSETVEKPLDALIRYRRHLHEGCMRPVHCGGGQGDLNRGGVEQVSGFLQDQQVIAKLEGLREFRRDHGHAVAAERHRSSRHEARDSVHRGSGHREWQPWGFVPRACSAEADAGSAQENGSKTMN
ncbi:hypothetical protein [Methylobacterium symbioticum]|uniref:hypothetical protein n=1 Tax=Methylobacterium symbioticum TaxID=2584084 RepID=UPI0016250944|nr:hypothetical protein [Methylobacterium symbioticum]